MSPTDGACRLPSSGRKVVAYFQEACKARNTQNDNNMKDEKKICQECGRELPLEEFARNRWGYTNTCKDCMKAKKAGKAPEKNSTPEPKKEMTLDGVVLQEAFREAAEMAKEHNERLRKAADFLSGVATPILMDELKRRGWSGTLIQHNELTI